VLEFDDPATVAVKLADTVAAAVEAPAERQWLETRLGPLLGLAGDPQARTGTPEQAEAFTAWRRFLEALAARRPLVLVVEDLHWADDALLAFLRHLVEEAAGVPLLVVATARPELFDRDPGWGRWPDGQAAAVTLEPLSDADTAGLIAALLGRAVARDRAHATLLGRIGGNPLYAEQVCRMLDDRGLLEGDGTLRLTAADTVLPDSPPGPDRRPPRHPRPRPAGPAPGRRRGRHRLLAGGAAGRRRPRSEADPGRAGGAGPPGVHPGRPRLVGRR